MPKKPSAGTYSTEFYAIILQWLYREAVEVRTRRAYTACPRRKKARRALACPPRTEPCIYLHEKISRRHLVVPLTDCRSLLVVFVVGLFAAKYRIRTRNYDCPKYCVPLGVLESFFFMYCNEKISFVHAC